MIKIHHIEGRRSERVAWLLEEIGTPYELSFVRGDVLGSLVALAPSHEMRMTPVVEDGPVVMVKSSAILEYLLARYGKGSTLRPAEDSPAFPAYLEFLHFAEGSAMPRIVSDSSSRNVEAQFKAAGLEPPRSMAAKGARPGSERVMSYIENTLTKQPYFAGDQFTAADIMMHFAVRFGALLGSGQPYSMAALHDLANPAYAPFPNARAFLERVSARPAYQRAMKACMPDGPPPF